MIHLNLLNLKRLCGEFVRRGMRDAIGTALGTRAAAVKTNTEIERESVSFWAASAFERDADLATPEPGEPV